MIYIYMMSEVISIVDLCCLAAYLQGRELFRCFPGFPHPVLFLSLGISLLCFAGSPHPVFVNSVLIEGELGTEVMCWDRGRAGKPGDVLGSRES